MLAEEAWYGGQQTPHHFEVAVPGRITHGGGVHYRFGFDQHQKGVDFVVHDGVMNGSPEGVVQGVDVRPRRDLERALEHGLHYRGEVHDRELWSC
jgi:hypothetical protein